jgi:hypothetical protein
MASKESNTQSAALHLLAGAAAGTISFNDSILNISAGLLRENVASLSGPDGPQSPTSFILQMT